MTITIWSNDNQSRYEEIGERSFPNSYRCHLAIIKDDDDLYSVIVLNLPGAGSSGSTEEEAIERVQELLPELIAMYLEDGPIPWLAPNEYTVPADSKQKWILVNA
jgi:predicted RNase H-like HicB family nuclease